MLSRVENENACKVAWVVHVNKVRTMITIFREEATSALAGFHAGPLSWSNWNLEILVFVEGGKPENPEKNPQSKAKTNNKLLHPHMAPGRNRKVWAT